MAEELPRESSEYLNPGERFSEARLKGLVADIEARDIISSERPYAIAVIDGFDSCSDLARAVEYPVFEETFGNTYDVMEQEYKPYDEQSVFLVAVDIANKLPFGSIRFIRDGDKGLKTINDVADTDGPWGQNMPSLIRRHLVDREDVPAHYNNYDQTKTLDLGTLAVDKKYRTNANLSGVTSACLYRAAGLFTLEYGYRDWVTIIDEKPFELIQAGFDNALEKIPGLEGASYLDSPVSFPAYMNVAAYFERMDRTNPGISAFLENADVLSSEFSFRARTS